MRSEIQKLIREDIRDMKRIGRNIKYQKGKRGYVGVMYDANKGMSEKKIKKMYDGEVVVYNMEQVMNIKDFKFLADDVKVLHLEAWRTRFSNKEIAEQMGIANSTFCNMLTKLGVTGSEKGRKKIIKRKDNLNIEDVKGGKVGKPRKKCEIEKSQKGEVELGKIIELENNINDLSDNIKSVITLKETTKGEKISNRLQAIAMLVNDDEEYTIELVIKR